MRLGASFTALYFTISATPNAAQHRFARRFLVSPVVGYQNKDVRDGHIMIGSIFGNVGDSDQQIKVSDIKPTGYLENETMLDDQYTDGDFQIKILTSGGGDEAIYKWYQDNDGTSEGWEDGYWYASKGDVEDPLNPGQGLWVYAGAYEDGYQLTFKGEPLMEARNMPLRDGHSPIAIPLARQVYLTEIEPTGHFENETMLDDNFTDGDFQIKVLTSGGGDSVIFKWYQDNDGTSEGWSEGYWYCSQGEKDVNTYSFNIGDAVWCYDGAWVDGEEHELQFPGFEDTVE